MLWFALGLLISAYNMQSIRRFVSGISPESTAIKSRLTWGFLLRYALNAVLLLMAIQFGLRDALFAFAGLWLYRLIFVWLVDHAHRMRIAED